LAKKVKISDLLVQKGHASSLVEAKALIMAGKVIVAERRVDKAGDLVPEDVPIRVKINSKFVSRAGDKLLSAIMHFKLENDFTGKKCLDVGSSTGGFTDCMLQHGARTVFTVDVGTNQLDWRIRNNSSVVATEKTDVRDFQYPDPISSDEIDWIVADVSFISLITILDSFERLSSPGTKLLLMVKPQFELPKSLVPEGGVIKDEGLISMAVDRVKKSALERRFSYAGHVNSSTLGRTGNQEVFLFLIRSDENPENTSH
jgi:23S rRNA (cytidine1920-2'-O)/16S rRNA (cytidine1409-2'-O)-methyltransferase